jgi:proton glutamate symport protein
MEVEKDIDLGMNGPSKQKSAYAATRAYMIAGIVLYAAGVSFAIAWHAQTLTHQVSIGLRIAAILILAWYSLKRRSLTQWIFWAMVEGIEFGVDASTQAVHVKVLSDIFLRLIKTIVAPLILGSLITGVARHGSSGDGSGGIGRLGLKSLVYFEVLTTAALFIGLVAINLSKAGVGLVVPAQAITSGNQSLPQAQDAGSLEQFLLHIFPENIAKSVAENPDLQEAVFALIFGLALGRLPATNRAPLLRVAESLTETMFQFTNIVMYAAPIGVGAALAYAVGHAGVGVMFSLGKLLVTYYLALIAFGLLVMLPVALLARVPIRRFLRAVAEPATIAFSTSTSEAALPRAMEAMEALGVPRRIVSFVIPAGYSFNMDGASVYLSLGSMFVAQAAGIHMGWKSQLMMVATLMLTSKGLAGVPRAGVVVLMASAATFHLPLEPIFLLLGIDAVMDMGRTTINVVGNCLASVVVAQWEGELGSGSESLVVAAAFDD